MNKMGVQITVVFEFDGRNSKTKYDHVLNTRRLKLPMFLINYVFSEVKLG